MSVPSSNKSDSGLSNEANSDAISSISTIISMPPKDWQIWSNSDSQRDFEIKKLLKLVNLREFLTGTHSRKYLPIEAYLLAPIIHKVRRHGFG